MVGDIRAQPDPFDCSSNCYTARPDRKLFCAQWNSSFSQSFHRRRAMAITTTTRVFLVLAILAAHDASAGCSDDWVECRKSARDAKKECLSSCDRADRECRSDCDRTQNSDYKDCDDTKAECRSSESSQSETRKLPRYQVPPSSGASATFCATNYGTCFMSVPIPIGWSCICPTPAGPIAGIAR